MGRINGRDCDMWINGVFMSGDTASFDINTSRGSLLMPQLNKRAQVRHSGLADFELMAKIWAEAGTGTWWDSLMALVAKDDTTSLVCLFEDNVGSWLFAAQPLVTENNWQRGDDGSLQGSMKFESAGNQAGWFQLLLPNQPTALAALGTDRASNAFNRINTPTDLLIWSPDGALTLAQVTSARFNLDYFTSATSTTPYLIGQGNLHLGVPLAGASQLAFIRDYEPPIAVPASRLFNRIIIDRPNNLIAAALTWRWLIAEGIAWT